MFRRAESRTMNPPRAAAGWLRRHLTWSNSRQSWYELLGVGALLGAALAGDKERRPLGCGLATDLRSREIVRGKLAARVTNTALLLVAGLPVLSVLQFQGGIDPELLLCALAALAVTQASIAVLSIL